MPNRLITAEVFAAADLRDVRWKWRIQPKRSMHFNDLTWRIYRPVSTQRMVYWASALSLESAMQFIGRFERGEFGPR